MKKSIQNLLAIVFLIAVLLTSTSGIRVNAATTPDITAAIVEAEPGSTVSLVISLEKNPGIWGLGLNVGYDHDALTLNSYTAGSIFTSSEVIPPQSLDKTNYFFLAARDSLENTTATGKLVTLNFTVANKAAYKDYAISLQLSNENTINNKAEEVILNCVSGKISVVKCLHKSSKWVTVILPTCEKEGSENLVCDDDNEVLDTRTIPALGHSFTKKVVSKETKRSDATYTKKATYFYTCAICGTISDDLYFENGDVMKSTDTTDTTDKNSETTTGSTTEITVTAGSTNKTSVTNETTNEPTDTTDSENEATVTTDDSKQKYNIIKGENSEWKTYSKSGLSITADGNIDKFSGIKVDGVLVGIEYYIVVPDNTIITLTPEYLGKLSEGKHTLTVVYSDGEVSTNFTITKELKIQENVGTDKKNPWISIIVLVFISGSAISFAYLKHKKNKTKSNN